MGSVRNHDVGYSVTITPEVRTKIKSANGVSQLIDAKARTWTSPSTGLTLKLRPVSIGLLNRIQADQTGKPKVPTIRVDYGGEWGTEANPNEPTYQEEYAVWRSGISTRVAVFTYSFGIDIEVPPEFRALVEQWHSDPSDSELKYYYVTAIIPSDEWEALTSAILGQTAPTEEGIADASAGFPSAGAG